MSKAYISDQDQQIIIGIAKGDANILNAMYEQHYPMIRHMVINNTGSEDAAKDIFQEAMIVLYDKITSGNFELTSKLKTYLYAICRRLWLKQLNSGAHNFTDIMGLEDVLQADDDIAAHREKDRQLSEMEQALMQLGEPCRSIIEDFYLHNLSMQDISDKFGYTNTDNAKTQKYKCLQRLKKIYFKSLK